MDCKIIWSSKARNDLRGLYEYYSERNRGAANRMITEIGTRIQQLTKNPEIAAKEQQLSDYEKEYRSLVVLKGNYKVIFYFENKIIYISRIWNCRQNPKNYVRKIVGQW